MVVKRKPLTEEQRARENARRRERRANDTAYRERTNARARERYAGTPTYRETGRKWREANPGYWRKAQYGLTPEDIQDMLTRQGGFCARPGCGKELGDIFNVDHCHDTGHVRGLLCPGCNTGIGKLGDNLAGLQRSVEYLERAEFELDLYGPEGLHGYLRAQREAGQ